MLVSNQMQKSKSTSKSTAQVAMNMLDMTMPGTLTEEQKQKEPLRFVLAAGTGTLFLVSLIVLRIYLGWSYVGDRLLSAVIPYEESGWYDGQMWVKPPETCQVQALQHL
ncbi:hypothetical protein LOK49_LG09G02193 [Camellia lanceoleosa]|uniref:Uncharacterized protein n=1 Tax=Camellia lanceoleosa TaxID=1840588 RepID=A0ACC0GFQ9_9ERIC|nr:hypothetical protein LOK49_LG09G02193 [Camellia lanceoleosa]